MHVQGEEKRGELQCIIRMIVGIEYAYNTSRMKEKQKTITKSSSSGKWKNLNPEVTTLLNSEVHCSTTTKKSQILKRSKKVWFIQNKSTETVPEKVLMADLLDKHFRKTDLNMLKQKLKEDVENSRNRYMNIMETSKKEIKN